MRTVNCICGAGFVATGSRSKFCSVVCRKVGARDRDAKWRAANRENIREKDRNYHANNTDKKRAAAKKWYLANRDKQIQATKKRRVANPEAQRASAKKWRANNLDRARSAARERGRKMRDFISEMRAVDPETLKEFGL